MRQFTNYEIEAILDAHDLIEYADSNGAYVFRGGDHYIQKSRVHELVCNALGLDYKTIKTKSYYKAIKKKRKELEEIE